MTDEGDFTAYAHPVLAVVCPDCGAAEGAPCWRPSGWRASDFHRQRKRAADAAFVARHGPDASIDRTPTGWRIDPQGRSHVRRRSGSQPSSEDRRER